MLTEEERKRRNAERSKRWREANPERARAGVKAWCEKYPEKKAASDRAYREANLEKITEQQKARREADPEKYSEYQRQYRSQPERIEQRRESNWKRKYGIVRADYDAMLAAQGGHCAVCPRTEPGGRGKYFHVDHDHETGEVRGLLCHEHNTALRALEQMKKLIDYAENPTTRKKSDK